MKPNPLTICSSQVFLKEVKNVAQHIIIKTTEFILYHEYSTSSVSAFYLLHHKSRLERYVKNVEFTTAGFNTRVKCLESHTGILSAFPLRRHTTNVTLLRM